MNDALYAAEILRECLIEAGDDTAAGLAAAEYILSIHHKGKGEGGGQFTSNGDSNGSSQVPPKRTLLQKAKAIGTAIGLKWGELAPSILDTGEDFAKIFYAAKKSAQWDAPLSPMQCAHIGTFVIAKAAMWLKKRMAKQSAAYSIDSDRQSCVADGLVQLFQAMHKAFPGLGKPPTREQVVAFLKGRAGKDDASLSIALAHDIKNKAAQGILNRAVQSAKGMSAAAKRDLAAALKNTNSGEAILAFVDKYRLRLARLLTTTQLAAVLEGAQEVANKVPPLGTVPVEGLPIVEQERIASLPPPEPFEVPRFAEGSPEEVHFPTIEEAVKNLAERNVITRPQYDQLDAAVRAKSFTVANVSATETLEKIRDSLAENVKEGIDYATWSKQVLQDVDAGTFMSDAHRENVFRTNIQSALSDGQNVVLQHPLVRSGFPYRARDAIHDDRVREDHLALEKLGIQGTNIYRGDDPVWQLFRVPWDYNDRCADTPLTVRQAAERGIEEAIEWLRTGVEPAEKAFVEMPDFRPPPGFDRMVLTAPLSIQLSMQPMTSFGDFSIKDDGENNRYQLMAEILVILFGDDAETEAEGLFEDDAALSIELAVGNPKVRKRYGAKPGPGWIPGGFSRRGVQVWLYGVAAPTAAPVPHTPAPAPTPAPTPVPVSPAASDGSKYAAANATQKARAAASRASSIATHATMIAKLQSGQALTAADKALLATKLTYMPTPLLTSLHAALGGSAAVTNAKARVAAVKAILASATPPAPTPPAPATPAPTPATPTLTTPAIPIFNTGHGSFDTTVNDALNGKVVSSANILAAANAATYYVPNADIARAIVALGGTVRNASSSMQLTTDLASALQASNTRNTTTPTPTVPTVASLAFVFGPRSHVSQNDQPAVLRITVDLIAGKQISVADGQLMTRVISGPMGSQELRDLTQALNLPVASQTFSGFSAYVSSRITLVTPRTPAPASTPAAPTPAAPAPTPKWMNRPPLAATAPAPAAGATGGPPGPPPSWMNNPVWNAATHRWNSKGAYEPPVPKLAVVKEYDDPTAPKKKDGSGPISPTIDHKVVKNYPDVSLSGTGFTVKPSLAGSIIYDYEHATSGYKVTASWIGTPPATGQPERYMITVTDGTGNLVSSYLTNAARDANYIESRAIQVAHWVESEIKRTANKPVAVSPTLAQFAHDYSKPGVVPFKIGDSDWNDIKNRAAVASFLVSTFPKLIGARQHAPHGGMDTVEHTMNIVNPLNLRTTGLSDRDTEILRLGMVFHDVGKQYDPLDHDHPRKSATDAEPMLWQFGLSEKEVHDTLAVIKWHDAYGDALQAGGGSTQANKIAKLAYEYTDDTLAPDARKTEALRVNNLLMRAWQSDLASIPGLTSKPIPGRPDIHVTGHIDVDTAGPAFEKEIAKLIDRLATHSPTTLPKAIDLPKKPATPAVGATPPQLVAPGCEWGELVQRTDNLFIGEPVPYDSTVKPPKEVYDEAHKHPDLNFARAFNMGYDGPTGQITTIVHGTDKHAAPLILTTGLRPGNTNAFGHGVYNFLNGTDKMASQYKNKERICIAEVHMGRCIDHSELKRTVYPAWKAANPVEATRLEQGGNQGHLTAAALAAGYNSITLSYYGSEPAVVVLDPARIRIKSIVGSESGGYKGKDVVTATGTVKFKDLPADEKKIPTSSPEHVPVSTSSGKPKGWDGTPRTT